MILKTISASQNHAVVFYEKETRRIFITDIACFGLFEKEHGGKYGNKAILPMVISRTGEVFTPDEVTDSVFLGVILPNDTLESFLKHRDIEYNKVEDERVIRYFYEEN